MTSKFDVAANDFDQALNLLEEYMRGKGYNWTSIQEDESLMVFAKTKINEMWSAKRIGNEIISILKK